MGTSKTRQSKHPTQKTPTFLLELPLQVEAGQASRSCPGRAARALPRTRPLERQAAFSALRTQYGFSDYALQDFAKDPRVSWLADHLDAVLAQRLATRAYQALNRVCVSKAKRVRFKSRGRGLNSIENKRNDTGLRFVLHTRQAGHAGYLVWHDEQFPALINWNDPVVTYGLDHRIKYARLIRRRASSPRAHGADSQGDRYCVQLILAGVPYQKPKHAEGLDTIGLDLGPASIAIVPREAEARLDPLCAELHPDAKRPKNANWLRTARVCMGAWSMRSSAWATRSSSKRFPTRVGRNCTARTRECGAGAAPKLWRPQSRSASARKSGRTETRDE